MPTNWDQFLSPANNKCPPSNQKSSRQKSSNKNKMLSKESLMPLEPFNRENSHETTFNRKSLLALSSKKKGKYSSDNEDSFSNIFYEEMGKIPSFSNRKNLSKV